MGGVAQGGSGRREDAEGGQPVEVGVPVGGGGGVAVLLGALGGDHGGVGVGEEAAQLGGDGGGAVGGVVVAPVQGALEVCGVLLGGGGGALRVEGVVLSVDGRGV